MPPYHTHIAKIFFWNCHYCGKGALCFCFEFAKVFLQGATMPSINQKNFWICHCGEGALCFRFDLAKVFLQGAPCHPNTQIFLLEFSLLWKGGIMLLLRLSQGISSGCHHVTPTPQFFSGIVIIVEGHYASASI